MRINGLNGKEGDIMDKFEYNYKMNRLCAIKNTLTLAAFTVLAIAFDKWWIVLFYILFHTSLKNIGKEE